MTAPLWLILLAGMNGTDATLTMRNMRLPHRYEINPVARQFVTHGDAVGASYFAGATVLETWTASRLERRGHKRLALAVRIGSAAAAAYGIQFTIRHSKP